MQTGSPQTHRWLAPLLLGVVASLLVTLFAGAPARMLVQEGAAANDARADIAAMRMLRADFLKARAAEQDTVAGRAREAWEAALSGVRGTLNAMPHGAGLTNDDVLALRAVVESYARAVPAAGADMAVSGTVNGSTEAMETVLGLLQARDEVVLREPLLGMRLAAMAAVTGNDPWSRRQLTRWAEIFTARLNEAAIPDGTRELLGRRFAEYEHALLDAKLSGRGAATALQTAARAVELALANANGTLADEQARVGEAFGSARERLLWLFGALLAAAAVMLAGSGIPLARAIVDRPLARG
jgi:hypothetical protein